MASKMYTKEMLKELVVTFGIKGNFRMQYRYEKFSVILCSQEGEPHFQVDLNLDMNVGKTAAYHIRHPFVTIFDMTGVEITVSTLRIGSVSEAKYIEQQFESALQLAITFDELVEANAVLLESI
jgi:hypothetical protein